MTNATSGSTAISLTPAAPRTETRAVRKQRAILQAAETLFLRSGYDATSMDQIAALAAVSKQTVYKHFADKGRLFRDVVLGITETVDAFIADATRTLDDPADLAGELRALARRYLRAVMQPRVLQLRRLVIAEAARFPELGQAYYERGPALVIDTLASCLEQLATKGRLRIDDPLLAANHLSYLILAIPLDHAMVRGDSEMPPAEELDRIADAAIGVFLAAYGPVQPAMPFGAPPGGVS
jgi:TetR/AcrR family transcriptional repressor of mexJK operon